ncbi:hypothetical protein, partial [Actinomyces sp. HMSC08A09]|uniref:hypothetical protein n=1 Tax=Actinomyces sp. HMSC08A09 TaxID=1581133 RepID=UPI001C405ED7
HHVHADNPTRASFMSLVDCTAPRLALFYGLRYSYEQGLPLRFLRMAVNGDMTRGALHGFTTISRCHRADS